MIANSAYYRGGGAMVVSCTPTFVNTTFTKNRSSSTSTSAQGAGLCVYSGAGASGRNNILYGNIATTSPNCTGSITMQYTCVQPLLSGTGNISSDPLHISTPPTGYAFLSQIVAGQSLNSPCVDAGDPTSAGIMGSTRTDMVLDAGIVDMGFHWIETLARAAAGLDIEEEFPVEESRIDALPHSPDLKVWNSPNPFNPTTTICYKLGTACPIGLSVYDACGRMVCKLVDDWKEAGEYQVTFDGSNVTSGMYLVNLSAGENSAISKMMLVK